MICRREFITLLAARRLLAARGARAAKRTDAACSYIDERRGGRPGDPSAVSRAFDRAFQDLVGRRAAMSRSTTAMRRRAQSRRDCSPGI